MISISKSKNEVRGQMKRDTKRFHKGGGQTVQYDRDNKEIGRFPAKKKKRGKK